MNLLLPLAPRRHSLPPSLELPNSTYLHGSKSPAPCLPFPPSFIHATASASIPERPPLYNSPLHSTPEEFDALLRRPPLDSNHFIPCPRSHLDSLFLPQPSPVETRFSSSSSSSPPQSPTSFGATARHPASSTGIIPAPWGRIRVQRAALAQSPPFTLPCLTQRLLLLLPQE